MVVLHSPRRRGSIVCIHVSIVLLGAEDKQGVLGRVIAEAEDCKLMFPDVGKHSLPTRACVYGEVE